MKGTVIIFKGNPARAGNKETYAYNRKGCALMGTWQENKCPGLQQ